MASSGIYALAVPFFNAGGPMLIKCQTACACQQDGYCIRKWQGLRCRDRKIKEIKRKP